MPLHPKKPTAIDWCITIALIISGGLLFGLATESLPHDLALSMLQWVWVLLTAIACASYATTAAYRLPRGESFLAQGKEGQYPYADCCNTRLTAKDLVPIFSWMTSRGKCRHCSTPVALTYPLIEFAVLAVFIASFLFTGSLTPDFFLLSALGVGLVIMLSIYAEHRRWLWSIIIWNLVFSALLATDYLLP